MMSDVSTTSVFMDAGRKRSLRPVAAALDPVLNDAILVFGLPRSGTSWLGKIFDSQPDTLYRHEPDTAVKADAIPLTPTVDELDSYGTALVEYLNEMVDVRSTKVSAKLPVFPKSYLGPLRYQARQTAIWAAKIGSRLFGELSIPDLMTGREKRDVRLVWKSIESLGRLGMLSRLSRDFRIIHIIRHPCGFIASTLRGEAGSKFVSATPAAENRRVFEMLLSTEPARARGLTIGKLADLRPEERLAWRWLLFNEKAMLDAETADNCLTLRYEDLCADPMTEARRLFAFAGLDWAAQTESFVSRTVSRDDTAYYSLYKNPLRTANRWRDDMARDDIERVRAIVAESRPGLLYAQDFAFPGDSAAIPQGLNRLPSSQNNEPPGNALRSA